MTLSMLSYALAALGVSVLAGTGVGGGGLFILYLSAVCAVPQANAQAINLVFFICAALAALPYHITHRKMDAKRLLICTVFAIAGTLIGTLVRQRLSEDSIRTVFGVMLVVTGARTLLRKKRLSPSEKRKV